MRSFPPCLNYFHRKKELVWKGFRGTLKCHKKCYEDNLNYVDVTYTYSKLTMGRLQQCAKSDQN